jgi:hypothetical protein
MSWLKRNKFVGLGPFQCCTKTEDWFLFFLNCHFFLSLNLFLVLLRLLAENKIPFSGSIEAHKFCLSALSPVFKQMFSGPLQDASQQVKSSKGPFS